MCVMLIYNVDVHEATEIDGGPMTMSDLKETTVTGRVNRRSRKLIEVAAEGRGVTVSKFVAEAAERAALHSLVHGDRQETAASN